MKRIFYIACVLLLLLVIAAVAFPSLTLRYIFSRMESKTGIAITFDRAYFFLQEGSFLAIDGLTVKQQNHPACNFDLKAKNVKMPAMVPGDFSHPVLVITGLRGTIERIGNAPAEEGDIQLQALMLLDAEVDFIDRTLEEPFPMTIQVKEFSIAKKTDIPLVFAPYVCVTGMGQIDSATFSIEVLDGKQKMDMKNVPLDLFAPYAPILDDIFVSGSLNIRVDDLTDETQKKLQIAITLLKDCEIKPANEILVPAIQEALQRLDSSAVPALQDMKKKIDRLKMVSASLRTEVEKAAPVIDALKALAPKDVREKYEKAKSQYDRITNAHDEWNRKFETLSQDIDKMKVDIVSETFQYFVDSCVPIEVKLQQVDGDWQCDWYKTAVQLIEKHYRAIVAVQFQQRILEIHESLDRLLVP